jgi:hypothetical protein
VTTLLAEAAPRVERPEHPAGLTLERLISGVWHDVSRGSAAACPVCAGDMSRPLPDSARGVCSSCGSELS